MTGQGGLPHPPARCGIARGGLPIVAANRRFAEMPGCAPAAMAG